MSSSTNRPFAGIGAALAGAGDVQRLSRVAGIALAQLDRGEACRRPGLVIPDAEHVGNAACLERAPNLCRAGNAFEQAGLVDRFVLRRASQYRLVAVENGLDAHERPFLRVVGVIAHPVAERAFRLCRARDRFPLDRDLAIGRDRKAGIRPAHHVDWLAA